MKQVMTSRTERGFDNAAPGVVTAPSIPDLLLSSEKNLREVAAFVTEIADGLCGRQPESDIERAPPPSFLQDGFFGLVQGTAYEFNMLAEHIRDQMNRIKRNFAG